MGLLGDNIAHCSRCGQELQGREHTCSRCQYSPRSKGLQVSLTFLMAMVVSMTIIMILPQYGRLFIALAALSFVMTFVTLVVSFVATPSSRLGSLFLWLSNLR